MIVMKFGGSSLATPDKIKCCINIVASQIDKNPVVVVSALGKTTDNLLKVAYKALDGKVETEEIREYHFQLTKELEIDWRFVNPLICDLENLLHGVNLLKELTSRTLDHILSFGERISSRILSAGLTNEGITAAPVNAYDVGLITDSNFGNAVPLENIDQNIKQQILKLKDVPVVTGFIAKNKKGNITTLGRSGSDYTASIIGAAIHAEEIQIWTDVDGVMTADPSLCKGAQNLPIMSFSEASELAYYGAEVLHPSTLLPAITKKIPVKVSNANKPEDPGTMILSDSRLVNRRAKSIVYKEDLCLITVVSQQFDSTVKLLTTVLTVLSQYYIDIHIAATSESSVSFVSNQLYNDELLERASVDLHEFGTVSIEKEKALICVVGEELKGNSKALGDIFTVVGNTGINARMVSQSASELNVAFLVENFEIETIVTALHRFLINS
jgi:aspartate kinase